MTSDFAWGRLFKIPVNSIGIANTIQTQDEVILQPEVRQNIQLKHDGKGRILQIRDTPKDHQVAIQQCPNGFDWQNRTNIYYLSLVI